MLEPRQPPGPTFVPDERIETCDLCGAAGFQMVDAVSNVVQCGSCGFRFVNPRPSQAQITAAYSDPHFYDHWVDADDGRRHMWWKRLNLLRRAGAGTRVLDIGAGIGTFLALARDEAGWSVTGTEVSRSAVALARERHEIVLLEGQADDVELPRSHFDVVTLWHVLEHVPSPSSLLRLCHEVLVPGGLLVVAVPNDADGRVVLKRVRDRVAALVGGATTTEERYYPLRPGGEIHLSHFTPSTLEEMLRRQGFRVQRVTVDDHYPQPSRKTDVLIRTYRLIFRLTGHNLGQAILVLSLKP